MIQKATSFVDLSSTKIIEDKKDILAYGLNYHLKSKSDFIKREAEVEIMFEDIREKQRSKKTTVNNEEGLNCELESFRTNTVVDHTQNTLTGEQYKRTICNTEGW